MYDLIEKVCVGEKCSKTFRTLPSDTQEWCSIFCKNCHSESGWKTVKGKLAETVKPISGKAVPGEVKSPLNEGQRAPSQNVDMAIKALGELRNVMNTKLSYLKLGKGLLDK